MSLTEIGSRGLVTVKDLDEKAMRTWRELPPRAEGDRAAKDKAAKRGDARELPFDERMASGAGGGTLRNCGVGAEIQCLRVEG